MRGSRNIEGAEKGIGEMPKRIRETREVERQTDIVHKWKSDNKRIEEEKDRMIDEEREVRLKGEKTSRHWRRSVTALRNITERR